MKSSKDLFIEIREDDEEKNKMDVRDIRDMFKYAQNDLHINNKKAIFTETIIKK